METPQIRPGLVRPAEADAGPPHSFAAFFRNAAAGNLVIQWVMALGVPADRVGVTTPDEFDGGQGMLLTVACPSAAIMAQAEEVCRQQGAEVHRPSA